MTPQEYIINSLNYLVNKYPAITFNYRFEKIDNVHIISVEPIKEYKENKEYLIEESDFVYNFENAYIAETIMFVSQDSLIKINDPDLVFKSNQLGFFNDESLYKPRFLFNKNLDKIQAETNDFALAA